LRRAAGFLETGIDEQLQAKSCFHHRKDRYGQSRPNFLIIGHRFKKLLFPLQKFSVGSNKDLTNHARYSSLPYLGAIPSLQNRGRVCTTHDSGAWQQVARARGVQASAQQVGGQSARRAGAREASRRPARAAAWKCARQGVQARVASRRPARVRQSRARRRAL
jgi:hypothetical protein